MESMLKKPTPLPDTISYRSSPSTPASKSKATAVPTRLPAEALSSTTKLYVSFSNSGGYSLIPVTATSRVEVAERPPPSRQVTVML